MGKVIKNWELIKAIENDEIEENTKFIFRSTIAREQLEVKAKKKDGGKIYLINTEQDTTLNTGWLINSIIEILDEEDEIDIQGIEEIYCAPNQILTVFDLKSKIHEILKAVKQLDNKIEEK